MVALSASASSFAVMSSPRTKSSRVMAAADTGPCSRSRTAGRALVGMSMRRDMFGGMRGWDDGDAGARAMRNCSGLRAGRVMPTPTLSLPSDAFDAASQGRPLRHSLRQRLRSCAVGETSFWQCDEYCAWCGAESSLSPRAPQPHSDAQRNPEAKLPARHTMPVEAPLTRLPSVDVCLQRGSPR